MYISIIFLPLLGSIFSGLFGRILGKYGSQIITTGFVSLSAIFSLIAFYEVGLCQSPAYVTLFTWIDSELLTASWGFIFDSLTVCMLVTVTVISSLVHLYSIEYMKEDPHVPRFMSYLSLFTFFMLVLVTGDNFIQLFVGWEGVGLSSYLLINFWFTRIQANKSAMKALIVNRVGDFGLSLAIFAIFLEFKAVDFSTVFALAPHINELNLICILLFIGAVGKSAQIGLHTWLPDAMEGPTPVSALIHAATMVTAGVFLIIRCSPVFEYAPQSLMIVTFVGAITAFFAATTAMVQNDLKRVIAYSTCSQLGYMIFACGLSNYSVSMFHLMNHAFFKALLFLSAGAVIHALADEQDMRKMGALIHRLPFTYTMILIGSLSLMGFPFLTGFYSKDLILEVAFGSFRLDGSFAYWLGTVSAFFTSFYSMRLIFLTFIKPANSSQQSFVHTHEPSLFMFISMFLLSIGSIFIGYLTKDMFVGLSSNFWGNSLFVSTISLEYEFLPSSIKLIPVIFSFLGSLIAFICYSFSYYLFNRKLYIFLSKKWYFDKIYNEFIVKGAFNFAYNISFKLIDRGIIETLGPTGIASTAKEIVPRIMLLQTGYLYHYILFVFTAFVILILFYLFDNLSIMLFELFIILIALDTGRYFYSKYINIE